MKILARILVFLCGLYVSAACAAYQPGAIVQLPTVASLQGGNFTNTPYINIANFSTVGDGGGGTFVPCTGTCTVDNGVIFQDVVGNKFLRQFKGVVKLPWYGVADATTSACLSNRASCDSVAALNAAFTAAGIYGNGSVSTEQRSIVLNSADVTLPLNSSLDCGGNPIQTVGQNAGTKFYWTLPSSIALNNAHSIITQGANAISNCLIFPTWYTTTPPSTYTGSPTALPATIPDMAQFTRLFTGTAVVQRGQNVSLSTSVIWGFDICVDLSNSGGIANTDVTTQCNNDWFIWGQRGGVELDAAQPQIFVQSRVKENGVNIDLTRWPVTGYTVDGSGQIVLTLDPTPNTTNCPTLSACLSTGMTMVFSGFQEINIKARETGDVTNGNPIISNLPGNSGNGIDGIGAVQVGASVVDSGTSGCNFSGLIVTGVDIMGQAVTLSGGAPTGCSPNPAVQELLTFTNNSAGPQGGNGRFILDSVSGNTVTLRGSSYAGPSYTGTKWNAGTSVLKTYDVTNIFIGQYVCASGTAPFCTTPTAFTPATTTSSNIAGLGTGTTGSISVGNAASWPTFGLFLVADGGSGGCTEWIAYQRNLATDQSGYLTTNLNVQGRGLGGTTICTHVNGQTLTSTPPQVISIVPSGENAVIVNSTATSTETVGQTVQFANDNSVTTGLHAAAALNFDYLPWTGNIYTAGGPFGPFTAVATTNSSTLLTSVTNPTKAQPMMSVAGTDIPATNTVTTTGSWASGDNQITLASTTGVYPGMAIAGNGIQNDSFIIALNGSVATVTHRTTSGGSGATLTITGVVVVSVSGSTVTMNVAAIGSHTLQKIAFGGCGYPAGQPWLGNCPSVDHQIGTLTGPATQGVVMDWPHGGRRNIETQLFKSPATVINKCVYGNGGGEGTQIDPSSVGIYIAGTNTDAIRVSNCKFAGVNNGIIIDQSMSENDGTMFDNVNNTGDILGFAVIGLGTNLTLEGIHGRSGPSYISAEGAQGTIISDNNAPLTTLYSDTVVGLSPLQIRTSANVFLTQNGQDSLGLAIGSPTGGAITGGVNTTTGAYKNGVEYSNMTTSTFTPTGATTPTTLPNFGLRSLSILDFGGVPDCATSNTSALAAAETAAIAQGVHVIRMDTNATGNCYAIGTHTIPAGISIVCPGPVPANPASNDYRAMPQRIALTTTAGLTLAGNSQISGCVIIQQALAVATPPATFQDNYTRSLSFTGTGVTVTGENADIRDTMILGFSVGLLTKASRGASFNNLYVDAVDCYHFWNQGGGSALMGNFLQCSPYATRFGTLAEPAFALSSITDNGSGVLQAHLTSSCTGTSCPLNGYKVWIGGGANASVQSAQGGWTAANVTSTTIDLQGSVSTFISPGQTESATTTTGSFVVSGITTNIAQVQKTQSITGTCIPAGATIAGVERGYGVIWLDSAHPASSTGACTVTITDTAPANVSISTVSIGNNAGTNYAAGDVVSLVGGTGTAALINIDQVDPTTGAVTALSINDGGSYTVSPGSTNVATTGGTGTSLTVNISTGATLYGSAVNRTGPAYSFFKITDVRLTNIGDLSHAIGITFGNGAHSVSVTNCSLHDENVLQDQTHYGIEFANISNNNKLDHCDSYYFGAAIYSHNSSGSNLPANVVSNSELGGSAGNSGLQNTVLDMASPNPGTPSKASLTLSGNLSTVFGTATVMGDERSLNMSANAFSNTTIYGQNAAAQALTTGAGNSFAAGSMPIAAAAVTSQIAPGVVNGTGGAKTLANSSVTYTPQVDGSLVFDTGALTNTRNLTLSNTGATAGFEVKVVRTGSSGGFNRGVYQADGTTLIANIADGATATFAFNANTSLWVKE